VTSVEVARALSAAGCDVIDEAPSLTLHVNLFPAIFDRETWARWRKKERPLVMDIDRGGVPRLRVVRSHWQEQVRLLRP
jgi:hypothetical protein